MGLLKLETELAWLCCRIGKRTLSVSTACMLAFSSFCVSPASAQTADQMISLIRSLGSAAGIIDACNENNEFGEKIDLLAEKPKLSLVKEYIIDGYKKGLNEKKMWDNGQWDQVSCEKLRDSGSFEETEKRTAEVLNKMLSN